MAGILRHVLRHGNLFIRCSALPPCRHDFCVRALHVQALQLAGHNKWSKVKGPKTTADLQRSKEISKLVRQMQFAIRQGGTDPRKNRSLARLLEHGKTKNVPKATLENVFKRAEQSTCERHLIEGRGPGGYSLIIDAFTDNKMRTLLEIRKVCNKCG